MKDAEFVTLHDQYDRPIRCGKVTGNVMDLSITDKPKSEIYTQGPEVPGGTNLTINFGATRLTVNKSGLSKYIVRIPVTRQTYNVATHDNCAKLIDVSPTAYIPIANSNGQILDKSGLVIETTEGILAMGDDNKSRIVDGVLEVDVTAVVVDELTVNVYTANVGDPVYLTEYLDAGTSIHVVHIGSETYRFIDGTQVPNSDSSEVQFPIGTYTYLLGSILTHLTVLPTIAGETFVPHYPDAGEGDMAPVEISDSGYDYTVNIQNREQAWRPIALERMEFKGSVEFNYKDQTFTVPVDGIVTHPDFEAKSTGPEVETETVAILNPIQWFPTFPTGFKFVLDPMPYFNGYYLAWDSNDALKWYSGLAP